LQCRLFYADAIDGCLGGVCGSSLGPEILCPLASPNSDNCVSVAGICGDGMLDPGEACDDGNNASGDGCSAMCDSDETCGNSIVDLGESCDDGNATNSDDCPDSVGGTCSPAACGDGFIHTTGTSPFETCDDGNNVSGDGCSAACLVEPFVETDEFTSLIQIELLDPVFQTRQVIDLTGPTTIQARFPGVEGSATDTDGNGLEQIPVEIVSMSLTGFNPTFGQVTMTLNTDFRSLGEIEETTNVVPGTLDLAPFGPTDGQGFFDVFVVISTSSPSQFRMINIEPIHIDGFVSFKPAGPGDALLMTSPSQQLLETTVNQPFQTLTEFVYAPDVPP